MSHESKQIHGQRTDESHYLKKWCIMAVLDFLVVKSLLLFVKNTVDIDVARVLQFLHMRTKKNLDLTQINYETLINFDIGAESILSTHVQMSNCYIS